MDLERIKETLCVTYNNCVCVFQQRQRKVMQKFCKKFGIVLFYTYLNYCTFLHIASGLRKTTSGRLSSHSLHCSFGEALSAYRISDKKTNKNFYWNIGLKFAKVYVLFKLISDNKALL